METERKAVRVRLVKAWTEGGNVMTATFTDFDIDSKAIGPTPGIEPVTFDRRRASVANRDQAERHGWEQKLGDGAAIPQDRKSGKSASVAEKRQAVADIAERLEQATGDWNAKGGRGPVDADSLIAKLAALGYDVSKVSKPPVDVTPQG